VFLYCPINVANALTAPHQRVLAARFGTHAMLGKRFVNTRDQAHAEPVAGKKCSNTKEKSDNHEAFSECRRLNSP
jgi:hypothetical protein